jgi:hypothetical protein
MPKTGEINQMSGIYRSDCCGVERSSRRTIDFHRAVHAEGKTRPGRLGVPHRRNNVRHLLGAVITYMA